MLSAYCSDCSWLFSQFYRDLHGSGNVSEHRKNQRPAKSVACMSNEHQESRMSQLAVHVTVGGRMVVCHLTRRRRMSTSTTKTIYGCSGI